MKRITIKDVAEYLNYSVATVSRALSDDRYVHPETKRRVVEAAEALGYKRNHLASRLRSGSYGCIGVVVNEMLTPFAASVLEGIQNVMHDQNVQVMIVNSHDDPERERRNLQLMENSMADGLIVCPCPVEVNIDEFTRLAAKGLPIVFFARSIRGLPVSKVVANDYDKAFFLIDHLLHAGRRRIVHLRGPEAVTNFCDIHRAYVDAHRKYSLTPDPSLCIDATLTVGEGGRIAARLMEEKVDFDAVFACSDLLAIGMMNSLRDRGLRVPEDVAVAGFSGSPLSQIVYPPLTTVEPDLFDMGRKAAMLLLQLIKKGNGDEPVCIIVDAAIRLRGSTHKEE